MLLVSVEKYFKLREWCRRNAAHLKKLVHKLEECKDLEEIWNYVIRVINEEVHTNKLPEQKFFNC